MGRMNCGGSLRGAWKSLAEGSSSSADPFVPALDVKYVVQLLPLVPMSFHISLYLNTCKLFQNLLVLSMLKGWEKVVNQATAIYQATLLIWHRNFLLLAVCCLYSRLLKQKASHLVRSSGCLAPFAPHP